MIDRENVQHIINEKLEGSDTFLVDLQVKQGNIIHVYLDKPEGISIEECVEMSRFINAALDKDIEDYDLEVSSPGLDMPFRVKQQYEKYSGKAVQVIMNDGSKYSGTLLSFDEEGVLIEYEKSIKEPEKKKKRLFVESKYIKFEDIKTTKAVVSFK